MMKEASAKNNAATLCTNKQHQQQRKRKQQATCAVISHFGPGGSRPMSSPTSPMWPVSTGSALVQCIPMKARFSKDRSRKTARTAATGPLRA